jgi:DNA-binding MarR family transcriptional regulator
MMDNSISMLPMLLHTLRKRMMEEYNKLLDSYGLTQIHVPYLMVLCHHQEGLPQKEMIDIIHLDKAHASRALKELVTKEIIIKEDKNTYKNKYFLSEKGLELTKKMKSLNRNSHEEVFSILTEEERKQLENIVKKMTDHLMEK